MATKAYSKGTQVEWNWGRGTGHGEVEEVHQTKVTRIIKGTRVTRKASPKKPAYTLMQAGKRTKVLKSHTELHETN